MCPVLPQNLDNYFLRCSAFCRMVSLLARGLSVAQSPDVRLTGTKLIGWIPCQPHTVSSPVRNRTSDQPPSTIQQSIFLGIGRQGIAIQWVYRRARVRVFTHTHLRYHGPWPFPQNCVILYDLILVGVATLFSPHWFSGPLDTYMKMPKR